MFKRVLFSAVSAGLLATTGASAAAPVAVGGVPTDPSKVCIIAVDGGADDCTMTEKEYKSRVESDLSNGKVPPGFAKLPPKATRSSVDSKNATRLAMPGPTTVTDIWENGDGGGFHGTMGYTGANTYWRNFSTSFWNNRVSSAIGGNGWTTYFHDLADGQGSYYAGLTAGRTIQYFSNANWQGTSTTINDRTTSWLTY